MPNSFDLNVNPLSGSQLEVITNDASALDGTEPVLVVQGASVKQTTAQDIADLAAPGGGVESVTGDLVDNTDPENPVVDRGFLVYYAKMNASGTDAPTLESELNGLGGSAITWGRTTTGWYSGSRSGGFPENRTLVFVTSGADPFVIQGQHLMPEDTIQISGFDDTWTPSDGLTNVSVSIIILPA